MKHDTWSFQHWTLASAPGHPVLRFMIDYITQNRHRIFSREGADMDALLRSGAEPCHGRATA
jgi:mannosyltransferase OCH1-like enzyme